MKETTYQRYKRENQQMRNILSLETFRFGICFDEKEHQRRLKYLSKFLEQYKG